MIPAEHDRRLDLTLGDEIVEAEPRLVPFAVAKPADPRGQALEMNLLTGHLDPPGKLLVFGEQLEDRPVSGSDIGRIAGQRGPPERAFAFTKQRPDVRGHEAREREGALEPGELGLAPDR